MADLYVPTVVDREPVEHLWAFGGPCATCGSQWTWIGWIDRETGVICRNCRIEELREFYAKEAPPPEDDEAEERISRICQVCGAPATPRRLLCRPCLNAEKRAAWIRQREERRRARVSL